MRDLLGWHYSAFLRLHVFPRFQIAQRRIPSNLTLGKKLATLTYVATGPFACVEATLFKAVCNKTRDALAGERSELPSTI
jgi:hypothetical protein